MSAQTLRFRFDETKAVETLAYIASRWPGITAFYAAKVLFFAEKSHLNLYGRPIVGDTFIAMPNGPVPSTIYDFIKGKLGHAGDPQAIMDALFIEKDPYPRIMAQRDPDVSFLSQSDIDCVDDAIAFCRGKTFAHLSNLTHREKSWVSAPLNGPMDYIDMIDAENWDAIIEDAQEFALYGVQ